MKLKNNNGYVNFIMRSGSDLVRSKMSMSDAHRIVKLGEMTESIDPAYPLGIDDKYYFEAEEEEIMPAPDKPKKGKSKR